MRFLLLVCLVGCIHVDRAALVTSSAALACDWLQTRSAASSGWHEMSEGNPLLGSEPTPQAVDTYFAAVVLTNALLWYVTPARWRSAVPLGVVAVQTKTIARNTPTTGLCGF